MNNNTILAIAFLVIAMLSIKLHCTNDELNTKTAEVNALENENATLESDRMFVLDSVKVLQEKLKDSEAKKGHALIAYKGKTRAEKTEIIKSFGVVTIVNEQPCLDSNAVDSINALSIHYHFCVEDNKTKDTIITHLTTANMQADTMLINKDKILKLHKKTAKIKLIKAAVVSGLVGIIIGLLI
jgi:spore maturation protein CgeB